MLAAWQHRHARDAELARAFGTIARDEARHAAFSWRLAAWLRPRLTPAARAHVNVARQRAVALLRSELLVSPHADVAWEAGVPSSAVACRLFDELQRLPADGVFDER
jgi:hypothetical protein